MPKEKKKKPQGHWVLESLNISSGKFLGPPKMYGTLKHNFHFDELHFKFSTPELVKFTGKRKVRAADHVACVTDFLANRYGIDVRIK